MSRHFLFAALVAVALVGTPRAATASVGRQGVNLQGVNLQGVNLQGVNLQGVNLQGVNLQGVNLQGVNLQGVNLQGTTLSGWWWDSAGGWWTYRYPDYYYGYWYGYWYGPYYYGGLPGSYMSASLSNGQTATLYMASAQRDGTQSTMVNPSYRSNADVYLYQMWILGDAGWSYLCPGDHMGTFMAGSWGTNGTWSSSGTTFACTSGVISKCARSWGYKPWTSLYDAEGRLHNMKDFHQQCVFAARADYCANGVSFTLDNTLVDLYDNFEFNTALPENAQNGMFSVEAYFYWGAMALVQTRYDEIRSMATCTPHTFYTDSIDWALALIIAGSWGEEWEQSAYDSNSRQIGVATSTYCSHNTCSQGAKLAEDCNSCTNTLCDSDPYCCDVYWDGICVWEVQNGYCGGPVCSNPSP
jgi:hypothetical protein